MDKPVLIFGAGSMAKSAMEIFRTNEVLVYGFLDDDELLHHTEIDGASVLGFTDDERLLQMIGNDCEAFIAVDENKLRKSIAKSLVDSKKAMPINAIHFEAIIAESAIIGHGNFFNASAIVGADVSIGNHCIIHMKASLDQGVVVGNYVQIGMGTNINSGVVLEEDVFIGSGVTIVAGVTVGKGARIGAGSVVVSQVNKNAVLFGNPASKIK